jgi:alpha-D-xyloside xylohydrolase
MTLLDNPLVAEFRFPAQIPSLPSHTEGSDPVARATYAKQLPGGLQLDGLTEGGTRVRIGLTLVAPGVARVELEPESRLSDGTPARASLARRPARQPSATVEQATPGQVRVTSEDLSIRATLDPFQITFVGANGRTLLAQDPKPVDVTDRRAAPGFGLSTTSGQVVATHDTFVCQPDEHFYGFGEKFTNFDKRGQWLEMWNYDAHGVNTERAYKNVPFFVSSRGYGLFVDSAAPIRFDMAATHHASFSVINPDARLDYYVIGGADPMEVIRRYAELVGRPILPPKWAFGLWVSSGFKADSAEATLARARELREQHIPAQVLHLDCYWQKWGSWSDLELDADSFPEPERTLSEIKELGFRVCLWINSYIGIESERFRIAADRGWLLRTREGNPYVLQLWGGYHPPVGILDLTHPEAVAWLRGRLGELLRMGADVFKTDFGEGVPADSVAYDGSTGEQLHNTYTLAYNDLVAEVTRAQTGGTGLVWGRSTYAGGQRHAAQWAGDPNCTYQDLASTLRGGLSMSACGHAFWSHDIGGFHGQPTPDLYVRWAQFGLLSPLARLHGTTSRLPWDYGAEAAAAFREAVRLRYRLLPYIYSAAVEAAQTGQPIMRALSLAYPRDPALATLDLEYLFGPDLLVAPIYDPTGRRAVVFPPGIWVDFWTNELIAGPHTREVAVPLEQVPLFVRANSLLPTMEPVERLTEEPWELVVFDCYLLDRAGATLHDLDGVTDVSASIDGASLRVELSGSKKRAGLRVYPLAQRAIESVHLNGQPLERRESLTLQAGSLPGWTVESDGTLIAFSG